jgi:hypothetical protein
VYLAKQRILANGTIPPQSERRDGRCRAGSLCLAAALLIGGCGTSSDAPRPASPTTYPDLASVPPRPQLTDTLADRAAIQAQLVKARQNAEFRAAELAYATGRAAAPPTPPAPPGPPPPRAPRRPAVAGDGAVARAYLDSSLSDVRDRGKLRQFMRRLDREAPDPFGPQTLAQAVGLAAEPGAASEPQPGTAEDFGDFLRDAFGFGDEEADGPPD